MGRLLTLMFAALGGGLIAAQAPINARLKVAVGSPFLSAALSFLVGTIILVTAVVATGATHGVTGAGSAPWWAWLGGLCGAILVTSTLVAAPRVGATATFVAVIAGQVLVAIAIDRFGMFGLPVRNISPERVAALGLIAVALVLLARGESTTPPR
ncbi:MAG: DMT family transporter [Thermoleophilia bacterium]